MLHYINNDKLTLSESCPASNKEASPKHNLHVVVLINFFIDTINCHMLMQVSAY